MRAKWRRKVTRMSRVLAIGDTHFITDRSTPMPNGCWEWNLFRSKKGYGQLWNGHRMEGAHRVSYRLFKGEIPDGQCVCHTCDNPGCVNPEHLFLGSIAENTSDRQSKGRGIKGMSVHTSKLCEADVRRIRRLAGSGVLHRDLAAQFGVDRSTISRVSSGATWNHVEGN